MGLAILIVWVIILGIAILLIVSNIKIVPQAHAYVVERLGGYKETWGVGLHFKMPILDRVARRVSLKEQVVDFEPQAVITKIMLRCRLIPSYSIRSLTRRSMHTG